MEQQPLSVEEKWALITKDIPRGVGNADHVIGEDEIKAILRERDISLYWGTATTGAPHIGYFVPIYKLGDFLKAGCHVTILFADLHGFLDNMKSTWELLHHRCVWYENIIREMLKTVGVPVDRLKFVKGTSYQLSERYTLDMYKMTALVTTAHTQHAGAEVVKQSSNPKMSNLLYPILQALDEEYLGCDVQFGGVDQRKIFMFAREWLPSIGYRKRAYVMNELIPGLGKSGKMSSSEPASKVDFHDDEATVRDKIMKAYSVDGQPQGNGLLSLLRHILFRYLHHNGRAFVANNISYATYAEVEEAFASGRLVSLHLKEGVASVLCEFLKPLRDWCSAHKNLYDAAYPAVKASSAEESVGLAGPRLEALRIASVAKHEQSDKHVVVSFVGGKVAVPQATQHEQLREGAILVAITNAVHQDVKGVQATAHLLLTSSFDKETKVLSTSFFESKEEGVLKFGPADSHSEEPLSTAAAGKVVKTLDLQDGKLSFKGAQSEPVAVSKVQGQIKI